MRGNVVGISLFTILTLGGLKGSSHVLAQKVTEQHTAHWGRGREESSAAHEPW